LWCRSAACELSDHNAKVFGVRQTMPADVIVCLTVSNVERHIKVKGNVQLRTGHEGPEGE